MSITFGSVGDIISVCLIVKDLVAALDDGQGSSSKYREVIRELWGLDRALLEVDLLSRSCESTIELNALLNTARKVADDCRKCITSFSNKIKKYGPSLEEGSSKNFLRDAAMKIRWTNKKDDLAKFRAEVNAHSMSIGMLLATASVKLLKVNDEKLNTRLTGPDEVSRSQGELIIEVRDRLKENNRLISDGNSMATKIADMLRLDWLRQLGSELKSLMERIFILNVATYKAILTFQAGAFPTALERSLVQEPFLLEDAIGRISPVHMQFISSWEAFDAVLEMRFRKIQGHKKVPNKEYVIQEHATRREIRRDLPWEFSFLPGQKVDMYLIFENKEEDSSKNTTAQTTCPRCQTASTGSQNSDIQCTSCHMWYRRITEYEDTEPAPIRIPAVRRPARAAFGQNGFGVFFGPPKPEKSASRSTSKRKLSETELEDTQDVAYFKRVRVVSKKQRIRYVPGPFARHNNVAGESILDPKAKQEAEEREARTSFEERAAKLGMDHSDTIQSLNALARCLRNLRKFGEAEGLLRAAFTSSKDRLVLEDPNTLEVLARNLMTVLIDQDKTIETGEIWQITKRMIKSNLSEERAKVLIGRLKLVQVFHMDLDDETNNGKLTLPSSFRDIQNLARPSNLGDSIAVMEMPSERAGTWADRNESSSQSEDETEAEKHRADNNSSKLFKGFPLVNGIDVNRADDYGETALHRASLKGDDSMAKVWIDRGANIEAKNKRGSTPLHFASGLGRISTVEILIERGADIEAKNKRGSTPLLFATFNDRKEIVELLIDKGADVNAVNDEKGAAIHHAFLRGNDPIARILIDKGADIEAKDKYGRAPLYYATRDGREEIVKLLVDKGADVNAASCNGTTALHKVSTSEQIRTMLLLLESGAAINAQRNVTDVDGGETALHLASVAGPLAGVQLLLKKGANIETRDFQGRTALHIAATKGREEVVRLLIENGADIQAKDKNGATALHVARASSQSSTVQLLLENGAT